jgi:hypothetical protein
MKNSKKLIVIISIAVVIIAAILLVLLIKKPSDKDQTDKGLKAKANADSIASAKSIKKADSLKKIIILDSLKLDSIEKVKKNSIATVAKTEKVVEKNNQEKKQENIDQTKKESTLSDCRYEIKSETREEDYKIYEIQCNNGKSSKISYSLKDEKYYIGTHSSFDFISSSNYYSLKDVAKAVCGCE